MSNSIRPGDAVFIRTGVPATVKEKDDVTGQLKLESDIGQVQRDMRHGYLNGINLETRGKLNEILDEVKGESLEPAERAEQLRLKIQELELDPHNLTLTRYLRAEMVHIMNTHGLKPKEYSINEAKAR